MKIDKELLDALTVRAKESPRLRMNYDLRTHSTSLGQSLPEDGSQRMLNALEPGTELPIHRHTRSTETLVVLRGRMEEIYYEEVEESVPDGDSRCTDVCRRKVFRETERILLSADGPVQGLSIPVSQWHTVNVLEPTVIFESKDGRYGEDGSENF